MLIARLSTDCLSSVSTRVRPITASLFVACLGLLVASSGYAQTNQKHQNNVQNPKPPTTADAFIDEVQIELGQSGGKYQPNQEVERFLDAIRAARAKQQAYSGTFVLSDGTEMTSTRMQYACDGKQFVESMEALDGAKHITAYDDQHMYSVLPEEKRMVVAPYYRSVIPLHALHKANLKELSRYYRMQPLTVERVAGLPTRVVALQPQDDFRYGYRVWLNDQYQWVLKMETLHKTQVLEHMVFTNIDVKEDAEKHLSVLQENTRAPKGYAVQGMPKKSKKKSKRRTSSETPYQWTGAGVPGFQMMAQQNMPNALDQHSSHWLLSDGLATVSVFAEPFNRKIHRQEDDGSSMRMGASTMYSRRKGATWVVATGEVPLKTLRQLVDALAIKE